jgi:hypothetical protein
LTEFHVERRPQQAGGFLARRVLRRRDGRIRRSLFVPCGERRSGLYKKKKKETSASTVTFKFFFLKIMCGSPLQPPYMCIYIYTHVLPPLYPSASLVDRAFETPIVFYVVRFPGDRVESWGLLVPEGLHTAVRLHRFHRLYYLIYICISFKLYRRPVGRPTSLPS